MTGGVWYRFNGKSLVWYPKDDFDAAGYTIPTTWDEMMALSRPDQGGWRCTVVRRHRVWCGHRLAGDGLDGRDHAAHHLAGELRQVGDGRAALQLRRK